jgi:hypothetical protein
MSASLDRNHWVVLELKNISDFNADCGFAFVAVRDPEHLMAARPPWKRQNPKKTSGRSRKLTSAQKAAAKMRAKRAGRRYPNLVDNMRASRAGK